MKTKKFLWPLCAVACLTLSMDVQGQASVPGNSGGPGNFSGWDGLTTIPLQVRHDGNYPIEWFTKRIDRMRLNPNLTGTIGQFSSINRDGYLLLSGQPDAFINPASLAPFTRLHLIDPETGSTNPIVYAQEIGFRPWQKNGITFTGNSDQAYIGQKYKGNDNTDFVLQWSDNPAPSQYGTDRMKFVFTTKFDPGATKGAATYDGLEAMRFWPRTNFDVNVGVGNFAPPGVGDPTERLHVLDGRVRIQALPDDNEADNEYKVMVVDDSADPLERGVVKWKNLSGIGGGCSSGWTLNGNNAVTAYDGNPCPPQAVDRVGIGATFPLLGKLHVESTIAGGLNGTGIYTNLQGGNFATGNWVQVLGGSSNRGVFGEASGGGNNIGVIGGASGGSINNMGGQFHGTGGLYGVGVEGVAQGSSVFNIGVKAVALNGVNAYGLNSAAESGSSNNYGVNSHARFGVTSYGVKASATQGTAHNYGVFASAGIPNADPWAGYFVGDVFGSGGLLTPSDEHLKENIEDLGNGLDVIMAIHPKTYLYRTEEFEQMSLPSGPQAGVLAQDLEVVLPALVRSTSHPAILDSAGQEVTAAVDFKAIRMEGIIPYLIAGMQAQQSIIANLQDQINNCCSAPGVAPQNGDNSAAPTDGMLQEQRLLIIPNPVADLTRLEYYVPKAGKVSLTVSTSEGKFLATLREEMAQEGPHNYSWNTIDLAAGTYLCTYILDGAVVVQRAVKVK